MKKFALALMALLLAATLCGCSSEKEEDVSTAAKSGEITEKQAESREPEIVEGAEQIWSEEYPDIAYTLMTDGTVAIECYSYDEELTIPETVDGYRVSTLTTVFDDNYILKRISIPDSMVRLNGNPFGNCGLLEEIIISPSHPTLKMEDGVLYSKDGKELKYVIGNLMDMTFTIPEGVQRIGDQALIGRGLTGVVFPESLTSIGDLAFGFSGLTEIKIPRTVTELGENPFLGCIELTEIQVAQDHPTLAVIDGVLFRKEGKELICYPAGREGESYAIPDRILKIGGFAFYGAALKEIVIPTSVKSIGDYAFCYCRNLISISIPVGVTSIGDWTFASCQRLESVSIPSSVTSIGDSAFNYCGNLTGITIPASVTSIGDSAFSNCESLTDITIPTSVTTIGDSVFDYCWHLTSITIPDSVTTIGVNPFTNCYELTEIIVSPDHPALSVVNGGLIDKKNQRLVCYLIALEEEHYDIPKGVREIGESAFSGSVLKSVTLPDSVTSIGKGAFSGCVALTGVTLPDSVTSIGEFAFGYCTSLSRINIPDSVTSIGIAAFVGCQSLTSLFIPDGVTSIGAVAFVDCGSLTLTVNSGSYAQRYCEDYHLNYTCTDALDWLYN